ncbi:MAG: hypothetical protein FJX35_05390 [Alphaproteobacteria bacterium]|nr:hypothetical protein [Alphaproteobacteria bacterium]
MSFVRMCFVSTVAVLALAGPPAQAAAPILRDTVCPGKPIQLKRKGQEYTLVIDRASINATSAVLRVQRPNRREEFYTLHNAGERSIATGGSVLRFKPAGDKDHCFDIL